MSAHTLIVDHTLLELLYTDDTLTLFVQLNRLERRAVKFTPEEFTHWIAEQVRIAEAWRMARARNYYRVLGVSREASADEIKKAYRRLARQHHPDLHAGDQKAKMDTQILNEAYETLSDPARRQQYDIAL